MARSSVVLPLSEGPSSATTSPRLRVKETPLRTWLSPSRLCTSETTRSFMDAHPEPQSDGETDADQQHVDDRQRAHRVDRARPPERHHQRTDHLAAGGQQVDAGGILADEDEEDEEPAAEESEAYQGERHLARDPAA